MDNIKTDETIQPQLLNPDDQYRKEMDEIATVLATKLVDGGLVNRKVIGLNKQAERYKNIKDTKRIIWECFYEYFQSKSAVVN